MEERTGAYRVLVGNLGENDHLEDPCTDVRITIRWICRKCDGGHGLDWSGPG